MSQKRITAFFSKPKPKQEPVETTSSLPAKSESPAENKTPTKSPENDVSADEGSPLKKATKTRKRVLISDSEDSGKEDLDEKKARKDEKVESPKKTPETKSKSKSKKPKDKEPKKTSVQTKSPKTEKPKDEQSTTKLDINKNEKESKAENETKVGNETKSENETKSGDALKELEESPKAAKQLHSFFTKKGGEDKSTEKEVKDVEYNPLKSDYDPIQDAVWKAGDKVPYIALARTLELIEATSSRLKMIEILANYLRSLFVLSQEDVLCSVYLCLNQLAPAYVGLELGVGEGIIVKALAQATGRSVEKVKADAAAKGDLGLVAETSKGTQRTLTMFKPPILTVRGVFEKLTEIASMTGNASQGKKVDKIQGLLVACRQLEARYLTRSLAGKLRIGLAEQSLLQALALASTITPPNQEKPPKILNATKKLSAETLKAKVEEKAVLIKTAYCQCPSYDRLIPALLREGVDSLPLHCTLTPGVPLKPMLACPTRGVSEVLRTFENTKFTCEWKYDGERAQIHLLENGDVNIYSRNQENNTTKYPDIIKRFSAWVNPSVKVKTAILDTEVVAWDVEKKQILPFQVLSTRKRKDAAESEIKVQICVFAFDLLYINGESMVKETLRARRSRLRESFHEVEGQFCFAQGKDPETMEEVEELLDESIKGHCEGLMVKALEVNATYEIAKRSHNWLKLKKDYIEGVGDTIDAVVIGGYLGRGKRTGVYGGFLLACYDENNEEFQSLCKIGTGFSDEDFQKHSTFFKDQVISRPKSYYRYDPSLEPDHWFEPVQVWEIKCADLSVSPVHRAAVGIVDPEKGISLRFPRFLRIRDDKHPEDATSASQIAELYRSQEQTKNRDFSKNDEEEDFY